MCTVHKLRSIKLGVVFFFLAISEEQITVLIKFQKKTKKNHQFSVILLHHLLKHKHLKAYCLIFSFLPKHKFNLELKEY